MTPAPLARKFLPLTLLACLLGALVFAAGAGGASYAELPDPLDRGPYTPETLDPLVLGTQTLQEPNGKGTAASGSNEPITVPVRGVMYMPHEKSGRSPLLVFVHGNHSSCDSGNGPACTIYKRNDEGYAYLGQNLASWGYTVFSLDQDELMARQDGSFGKGMHNRRLLIMAALDALKAADESAQAPGPTSNVEGKLVGKLDLTRIGLMGHSRGGDAVANFIPYDQSRPAGERYPLRAVLSLAPVDYERHAPYGVPYMALYGSCDGDVSNLQGARLYERSQYAEGDPYPRFQVIHVGANHNSYNTVWQADNDDAGAQDAACGPDVKGGAAEPANPHSIRLSGEAGPHFEAITGLESESYKIDNSEKLNPLVNTRISGDPALMGDQEKIGLATMAAFLRRYVGGEGAFEPYLTGELAAEGKPSIPQSACPSSEAGTRIPCIDRVADSYTAPPAERLDVVRPDTEHPTTLSALGSKITQTGFANPYPKGGGVTPRPTADGITWCNPEPKSTESSLMKEGEYPTAAKWCPQPGLGQLGGQAGPPSGTREKAPVNGSYGRQLSLAWEGPATMTTPIPAADGDVSGYKALYLAAAVNFFDPRNPARGEAGLWNPEAAAQNFTIAVTDGAGQEATVAAGDPRYGTALQQTLGSTSFRVHVILRDIRVPLADLAAQGLDLTDVRKLELRFGGAGMPQSGSIQLADVRFQQPASGYSPVLLDSTAPNAGPGEGPPASGPNPVAEIEAGTYPRGDGSFALPDVTEVPGANVWTVDDDGAQCPNAQFERIQEAVDYASPWETIVVCAGTYAESSVPIASEANPVQAGAVNGLTITKPLQIVGAGAGLVTIKPAPSPSSLYGSEPNLRDGGGNVVTVSRQSLGSSEWTENYVDISGVTIESANNYAEAGVAFFNTSGRIADSVIGPLKRVAAAGELTTRPHGYGIVATNSLVGAGAGTVERQVTVVDSKVYGYQAGGVRIDDGRGADAAASANEPSGIKELGYIRNTTIEGQSSAVFPQVGVQFHAGAGGRVSGSVITGNSYATTPSKSAGVLLTEAGPVTVTGSLLAGNGYGIYNANAADSEVRKGSPVSAAGNFWGAGGDPVEGPTQAGPPEVEGISPKDGEGNASVLFGTVLGAPPSLPAVPAALPDDAPVGAIVNPGDGESVVPGTALEAVVAAEDDYGVRSVTLSADGKSLGTITEAPYTFAWTPGTADAGKTVTLQATIADSSGQTTTSTIAVPVEAETSGGSGGDAGGENPPSSPQPPSSPPPASGKPKPGKLAKNPSKGTAVLTIAVPGPGKLKVYGKGVKTVTKHPKAAGPVALKITAKGQQLKALKQKGKVTLTVKVGFAPTGGAMATAAVKRTVVLILAK